MHSGGGSLRSRRRSSSRTPPHWVDPEDRDVTWVDSGVPRSHVGVVGGTPQSQSAGNPDDGSCCTTFSVVSRTPTVSVTMSHTGLPVFVDWTGENSGSGLEGTE